MVADAETSSPPMDRVLVLHRVFDAPRELVFAAWTRPQHLVRWFGPSHFTLPHCETDFSPGGSYRFCMRAPDGTDHWVWGTYREIVEPARIVFTWNRDPDHETLVTVTLDELGDKTKLTLHHANFRTKKDRDEHQGGWTECLERLAAHVETL